MDRLEGKLSKAERIFAKEQPMGKDFTLKFVYVDGRGKDVDLPEDQYRLGDWCNLPNGNRVRIQAPMNDTFWDLPGHRTAEGQQE